MKNKKEYLFPLILLYLALMCLYVSYTFIIKDYNITKSIYQPYKTFLQISPFDHWNVFITLFKGIFGVAGFIAFLLNRKVINPWNTLFFVITILEIALNFFVWAENFKDFSVYVSFTGIIVSAVLFAALSYFYFRDASFKKVFPQIILGLLLTVLSYNLH